ncbi:hypothetical protein HRED_04188 [Candidatus Haloredivivus sp. G17]|nr:hypothetical protein HRED_04188 [Candidatus Haloredivivus sp. G17]
MNNAALNMDMNMIMRAAVNFFKSKFTWTKIVN